MIIRLALCALCAVSVSACSMFGGGCDARNGAAASSGCACTQCQHNGGTCGDDCSCAACSANHKSAGSCHGS